MLWPSTPYSAKFSGPFAIALGLVERAAGVERFTDAKNRELSLAELASRVTYEVDPANAYSRNYTGDVSVRLKDGSVRHVHQPYLSGGVREPIGRDEIALKFRPNALFGDWPEEWTRRLERFCETAFEWSDLGELLAFRS